MHFSGAMLREGLFHPFGKYSQYNRVLAQFGRDIPDDYELPALQGRVRQMKRTCPRQDCPFRNDPNHFCRGGRQCEREILWAHGAAMPELAEDFIGPIQPHVLLGGEAPPPPELSLLR